jgi:hypothetical protein
LSSNPSIKRNEHVEGVFAASAEPRPPTVRNAPTTKAARTSGTAASRTFIALLVYASRVTLSRPESGKQPPASGPRFLLRLESAWPAGRGPLRGTFATEALAAGPSIFELSRVMGASVKAIDKHYGHLARATPRRRFARVLRLVRRGPIVVRT